MPSGLNLMRKAPVHIRERGLSRYTYLGGAAGAMKGIRGVASKTQADG